MAYAYRSCARSHSCRLFQTEATVNGARLYKWRREARESNNRNSKLEYLSPSQQPYLYIDSTGSGLHCPAHRLPTGHGFNPRESHQAYQMSHSHCSQSQHCCTQIPFTVHSHNRIQYNLAPCLRCTLTTVITHTTRNNAAPLTEVALDVLPSRIQLKGPIKSANAHSPVLVGPRAARCVDICLHPALAFALLWQHPRPDVWRRRITRHLQRQERQHLRGSEGNDTLQVSGPSSGCIALVADPIVVRLLSSRVHRAVVSRFFPGFDRMDSVSGVIRPLSAWLFGW